jgi:pseudouridine-5'-phosphate glycosidase
MQAKWGMALKGGMVIANPIPEQYAMPSAAIDAAIEQALAEANAQNISGKQATPFLLARVCELTGGDSLASNIQLVLNNARLASAIATAYCQLSTPST